MGIHQKITNGILALSLALLISPTAFANTSASRLKSANDPILTKDAANRTKDICTTNEHNKCAYMPQADAFETAGEQAVFLGAYQMSFGPYGAAQGDTKRNEILQKTATAIDDCVNGRSCGADKQELVLKALIQYNMGQDIKRMMLTNNTNKERMRSIENYGKGKDGKNWLNTQEIENSLATGKSFTYTNGPDKMVRANRGETSQSKIGKKSDISRKAGTGKDTYYQLDEGTVNASIDSNYLKEREILGEQFLKDYGLFLDTYAKPEEGAHYKFVKARETYVYDEGAGKRTLDPNALFEERVQEQQKKEIQEAMKTYRQSLKPVEGQLQADGKMGMNLSGMRSDVIGLGEMATVNPVNFPGLNVEDLKKDGALDSAGNAKAVARVVNQSIRQAAEAKLAEDAAAARARSPASGPPISGAKPNTYVNVTLSPKTFGDFLDEIWPTKEKRRDFIAGKFQQPKQP